MELIERTLLFDIAVAQNIGTKDHAKRAVSKGKLIDRCSTDRACALDHCPPASLIVSVKAEQDATRVSA